MEWKFKGVQECKTLLLNFGSRICIGSLSILCGWYPICN